MKTFSLHYLVLISVLSFYCIGSAAQCPLINIRDPLDWTPYTFDYADNDDIGWDVTTIDEVVSDPDLDKDDGVVVVGSVSTALSGRRALIIRLNNTGGEVWTKVVSTDKPGVAYAVTQASDGNLLVCGSRMSTKFGSSDNWNAWFFKLNITTGAVISGSDQQYGGSGNEDGFDIIEDVSTGYYIIAGGTGHIADGNLSGLSINGLGEYWVFAIDPGNNYQIVWQQTAHGIYTGGNEFDWAFSIIKEHGGNYVVSGYCASCEPDKTHQQAMVLKIESDGDPIWKLDYGDLASNFDKDQGANQLIEVMEGSDHYYVSAGTAHTPGVCYGNLHDCYGLKTDDDGADIWTPGCWLNDGINYGGAEKDDAYDVVPACGGYIIVGRTNSPGGFDDVTCNNGAGTHDAWILKVDNATGAREWDESLGSTLDDEFHSIIRKPNGSYVAAGELGTGALSELQNLYVVQFQLEECTAISGGSLQATVQNCSTVLVSWGAVACAVSYELTYKPIGGSWSTPITTTLITQQITGLTASTGYSWRVRSICSPNVQSTWANGTFSTSSCRLGNENSVNEWFSVFPNPSDGMLHISIKNPDLLDSAIELNLLNNFGITVYSINNALSNGIFEQHLSVEFLPHGLYRLQLKAGDTFYNTKLVIQ